MKTPATSPFAALMGLPSGIRKKAKTIARKKQTKTAVRSKMRHREPRPAAAPVRRVFHAARAETRRSDKKSQPATFAELLGVNLPPPRTHHQAAMAVAGAPVPQQERLPRRDGLSPAARRIIALGAKARGENIEPDGIESQLRHARDEACGITAPIREIIDRAVRRQASKQRATPDARAMAGAPRG